MYICMTGLLCYTADIGTNCKSTNYTLNTHIGKQCWQGHGESETLCFAGRNIKWYSCCGKAFPYFLKKLNIGLAYGPKNVTFRYLPKSTKSRILKDICIPMFRAVLFPIAKR